MRDSTDVGSATFYLIGELGEELIKIDSICSFAENLKKLFATRPVLSNLENKKAIFDEKKNLQIGKHKN